MALKKVICNFSFFILLTSCFYGPKDAGREYNNTQNGGFQYVAYYEQETPPDMVLVEGGAWPVKINFSESDSVSCTSFYISKYEETNGQYLAYVSYLKKYYSESTYKSALPDTTVWKKESLAGAETRYLVENYFRNPLYKDYPVVGVSTEQAKKYAAWKTDRMNEFILIREGVLVYREPSDSTRIFTTENYLANRYYGPTDEKLVDLSPKNSRSGKNSNPEERIVRIEDGILMPRYRLPFLNEWAIASLAVGDRNNRYVKTPSETPFKKYDHDGRFSFLKINHAKQQKEKTVSEHTQTIQKIGTVYSGGLNKYGIYCMAGGVREMVACDSLSFLIVGGYWKAEENYTAVYQKTAVDGNHYVYPKTLESFEIADATSPVVYGFRLAMDHIGLPFPPNSKGL